MTGVVPPEARAILDFWFGAPGSADYGRQRTLWFRKRADTDRTLRARFGALTDAAVAGALREWEATPHGALARILLLDQFTRNIHRNTPQAFAGDTLALDAACRLIDSGALQPLIPVERAFVFMPFEHAEDLACQDRAVALFEDLAREHPDCDGMLDYARRHREVIARFGRFPHRNVILGRESTAAESTYLAEPGSGF
ncbi:DUF924 domain-containing protein [Nitrogeniibacter mangrovi]|uniref:DUF924 domain-containing protein n=1 Tax=Nitrogeniibacter mangrovi TaxID=2016596 RepID=A0A6C1AY85_9RHOO|nr:DUF924 family protein [Nitrogeniibacter mangrovi]QID16306.1 DUF924 domain-containing protein [Nitrogeniibacter mangrovi]